MLYTILMIVIVILVIETLLFIYFKYIIVEIFKKIDNLDEPDINIYDKIIIPSITNESNYIIINGKVLNNNESIECTFLIDSGATSSFLKKSVLQKLGTKSGSTPILYGNGHIHDIDLYIVNVEIGSKHYEFEMGELFEQLQDKFDGILGSDFLKTTKGYIDYNNNLLIL